MELILLKSINICPNGYVTRLEYTNLDHKMFNVKGWICMHTYFYTAMPKPLIVTNQITLYDDNIQQEHFLHYWSPMRRGRWRVIWKLWCMPCWWHETLRQNILVFHLQATFSSSVMLQKEMDILVKFHWLFIPKCAINNNRSLVLLIVKCR